MLSRALFDLARQGYGFPRQDALRVSREYRPATFPPVRVRVLRPFYGLRRLLEAGEVVAMPEPEAEDAIALGRARRA